MDRHTDILYRLARFLAGIPPEALGAMVLLALQHPGLVAALFAIVVMVLKFVVGAVFFVLKFVLSNILGSIVVWYLGRLFMIHAWPRLPHGLRQVLLKTKDRTLMIGTGQDQAATRDEKSAYSRNSKRHPH